MIGIVAKGGWVGALAELTGVAIALSPLKLMFSKLRLLVTLKLKLESRTCTVG